MFSEPEAGGLGAEASALGPADGEMKTASSASKTLDPAMLSEADAEGFGAKASGSGRGNAEVQTAFSSVSGALGPVHFSEPEAEQVGSCHPEEKEEAITDLKTRATTPQLICDPPIEEHGDDFGDWEDVGEVSVDMNGGIPEQLPEPEREQLGRVAAEVAESALKGEPKAPEVKASGREPEVREAQAMDGDFEALEAGVSGRESNATNAGAMEGHAKAAAQKLNSLSLGSSGALDAALFSEEGYSDDTGGELPL